MQTNAPVGRSPGQKARAGLSTTPVSIRKDSGTAEIETTTTSRRTSQADKNFLSRHGDAETATGVSLCPSAPPDGLKCYPSRDSF